MGQQPVERAFGAPAFEPGNYVKYMQAPCSDLMPPMRVRSLYPDRSLLVSVRYDFADAVSAIRRCLKVGAGEHIGNKPEDKQLNPGNEKKRSEHRQEIPKQRDSSDMETNAYSAHNQAGEYSKYPKPTE